jgi:hypothetical protein
MNDPRLKEPGVEVTDWVSDVQAALTDLRL